MATSNFCLEASNTVNLIINSLNIAIDELEINRILLKLDYLTRTMVNLEDAQLDGVITLLQRAYNEVFEFRSSIQGPINTQPNVSQIRTGRPGRPSFEIKEEQLSFLINSGFKIPVIARLFRVSERTIERRMSKYGLSVAGKL